MTIAFGSAVNVAKASLLAAALRRCAEAHGRPNTVSNSEIIDIYASKAPGQVKLTRRDLSELGRSMAARFEVYHQLGGRAGWGSAPTYHRGRWHF